MISLCVTGGAEMASFAGECKEIFMTTAMAFYSSKPVMKYTAVEILVYYFFYVGS